MLTDTERNLVQQLFSRGPAVLFEDAGMTLEGSRNFIERDDVQQELNILRSEMDRADGFQSRVRFVIRRNLAKLGPAAVALRAQAMAGPIYARDDNGNVLMDKHGNYVVSQPEPTKTQMTAADNTLKDLNVGDVRLVMIPLDKAAAVDMDEFQSKVIEQEVEVAKIEYDPGLETEEERALSRERVRNALDLLAPSLRTKLAEAKEEAKVTKKAPRKPRAKKTPAAKKSAAKKPTAKKSAAKKTADKKGAK